VTDRSLIDTGPLVAIYSEVDAGKESGVSSEWH